MRLGSAIFAVCFYTQSAYEKSNELLDIKVVNVESLVNLTVIFLG